MGRFAGGLVAGAEAVRSLDGRMGPPEECGAADDRVAAAVVGKAIFSGAGR